ncbi:hypothetical protein [Pseudomonas carassii]|uniref:Uncharacterized protein n=1 Tax=Pseudomonas carassii TaxID=3115855 RepID=A0ABU7H8E8_9PSED|nr:hypothetical protein [Pseudomonas sp. 137P]MEE1887593.1 hypothetical protein [Pseudomonas sp. 137P]
MRTFGTAALLALFMMGNAIAATCPDSKTIKETAGSEDGLDGYVYSVESGNWRGFAPDTDDKGTKEVDLATLKLSDSKASDTSVICRYTDAKGGGLSLSQKK